MNYSDKLKNPKWQKKRLSIMQRDGFKCRLCSDLYPDETLHVHHIGYDKNTDPWDYPDNKLITLCDIHHQLVHKSDNIEVIECGCLSVYDFIQKYPWSIPNFSKIENHKGDWCIELDGGNFFTEKLELLSNLAFYIQGCDCRIYLDWLPDFNFCDYLKPKE